MRSFNEAGEKGQMHTRQSGYLTICWIIEKRLFSILERGVLELTDWVQTVCPDSTIGNTALFKR
jgi:hypothetical protein